MGSKTPSPSGGSPSEVVVAGKSHGEDRIIEFPIDEVKRLTGLEVPLPEIKRILTHLGFLLVGKEPVVKVAIPSWRSDVHGKADIVEEIVRIVGVDRVPLTPFERGDAPRKNGSCVIHLKGPHAGDWFDFDGNAGGGPLSTVAEATGLEGRQLLSFAAGLAGALPSVGGAASKSVRSESVRVTGVSPSTYPG